jgi:DNA-binding FadR family transcriptional regulator
LQIIELVVIGCEDAPLVVSLLSRYIDAGEGTRIPPERQLAAEFGVSRSEVRKALSRLELDGWLSREIGRGTFVRTPPPDHLSALDSLQRGTSPREAMEARLLIEPELASLSAVNATYSQIEAMHALAKQMRQAETWKAYEQYDGRLHRLIAESTGNKLLVAVHKTVDDVRRAVVWKWLDTRPSGPPADYTSFEEHDAIITAIEQRDRLGAMEAMRRHLRTTSDKLLGSQG